MNLKTLKDFDVARDNQIVQDELIRLKFDLRQEAIKHIKAIRIHRAGTIFPHFQGKIACEFWIKHSLDQDWIKYFFGISEGDLK